MPADVQLPLVGRTTLTPADGAVLIKASQSQVGYFNQPRLVRYYAAAAVLSAIFCIEGYDLVPKLLLVFAVAMYVLAIVVGFRGMRMLRDAYGFGQEREIIVDDDGMTIREPGMTVTYTWARFKRATETADHFALLAGVGILVVPKRAFDAESFARVRALIAAKIPPQGRR